MLNWCQNTFISQLEDVRGRTRISILLGKGIPFGRLTLELFPEKARGSGNFGTKAQTIQNNAYTHFRDIQYIYIFPVSFPIIGVFNSGSNGEWA